MEIRLFKQSLTLHHNVRMAKYLELSRLGPLILASASRAHLYFPLASARLLRGGLPNAADHNLRAALGHDVSPPKKFGFRGVKQDVIEKGRRYLSGTNQPSDLNNKMVLELYPGIYNRGP